MAHYDLDKMAEDIAPPITMKVGGKTYTVVPLTDAVLATLSTTNDEDAKSLNDGLALLLSADAADFEPIDIRYKARAMQIITDSISTGVELPSPKPPKDGK